MVSRETFLSPTETSHYAKKNNPQTSKLFICMLDWMYPLTRKNNSTIMTTNPSFSFFVFLINNTHCQEKCHRFCDLSPRVYEQSYCSWYKTTGIIKPSFYVMVAILANKKTSSHCTGFSLLNSSNSTTQLCWCHQHDDIITLLDRLYQSWTNHFIWQSFSKQLKIIYAKKIWLWDVFPCNELIRILRNNNEINGTNHEYS